MMQAEIRERHEADVQAEMARIKSTRAAKALHWEAENRMNDEERQALNALESDQSPSNSGGALFLIVVAILFLLVIYGGH